MVNAGYTDGTNKAGVDGTLYVSLWDWRVPVAVTSDGSDDGVLSDVTAASIRDWAPDSFDFGTRLPGLLDGPGRGGLARPNRHGRNLP